MTYSLVARDPDTGLLGVAVHSHWFSVGSIVSWAEPGVGAVATQSFAEPSYGPLGLGLMQAGRTAAEAVSALVSIDPEPGGRQVAMVDAAGVAAVHTGANCLPEAGHRTGEGYSAQANMMAAPTVPEAMAEAYERSAGAPLEQRLLAALEAAEGEGGDIRGRQSAAMIVVAAQADGRPWAGRLFDLRVEDHPDPVGELRRLVGLAGAYARMNRGDELASAGDLSGALEEYTAAHEAAPDNLEMAFWRGVMLANAGRVEEGRTYVEQARAAHSGWAELLRRLSSSGLLDDRSIVAALLGEDGG